MSRRECLNTEPIDDDMTVLDLMVRSIYGGTRSELYCRRDRQPVVDIACYTNGGDYHSTDRVLVTRGVVERLEAARLLEGKPYWGGRETWILVASDAGEHTLWSKREELGEFPRAHRWFEWVEPNPPPGTEIEVKNEPVRQ